MSASPIELRQVRPGREFYLAADSGKFPCKRYRKEASLLKVSEDPVHHVHAPPGEVLAINEADKTIHLFPADTPVYD